MQRSNPDRNLSRSIRHYIGLYEKVDKKVFTKNIFQEKVWLAIYRKVTYED